LRAGPGTTGVVAGCKQIAVVMRYGDPVSALYLRNVPDDVVARLARLAAREGVSVSAPAVREPTFVARRLDDAAAPGALPDPGVAADAVVADVEARRSGRRSSWTRRRRARPPARRRGRGALATEALAAPHPVGAGVAGALRAGVVRRA
jgi:hypothetical protein